MAQSKLRTANTEGKPENKVAIQFVKDSQAKSATVQRRTEVQATSLEAEPLKDKVASPKQTKKRTPPSVQVTDNEPVAYKPFSTRIRADLKRQLKRLSHHREDTNHEVRHVQDFIEEAVTEWLDRQSDAG